jgi:hypothetical protein
MDDAKPSISYKCLYPALVRRADRITVAKGLAQHVRVVGYWPTRKELVRRLRCDSPAAAECLNDLIAARYVERFARKAGSARYILSSKGWDLLGLQPIEPWRRPPTNGLLRRSINAAAARALRDEAAAREAQ